MINERRFEEIKSSIETKANREARRILSWENVGRNYGTRKDGKPFADPVKALQGVDGIRKVEKWANYRIDIRNNEGFNFSICSDNMPSLNTSIITGMFERGVEREIREAQEEYRYYKFVLDHLQEFCERCDDFANDLFSVYTDELGDTERAHDGYGLQELAHDVLESYFDEAISGKESIWKSKTRKEFEEKKSA